MGGQNDGNVNDPNRTPVKWNPMEEGREFKVSPKGVPGGAPFPTLKTAPGPGDGGPAIPPNPLGPGTPGNPELPIPPYQPPFPGLDVPAACKAILDSELPEEALKTLQQMCFGGVDVDSQSKDPPSLPVLLASSKGISFT